jgi:hypothetical protein
MTEAQAPLREIVAVIGRHAVRLACGHVEYLAAGEAEAIGRKIPCERCPAAPAGEGPPR